MLPERAILFALETEKVYLKVISLNKRAKSGDVEDFNFRRVEHGEILSVSDSAKVSTEMHYVRRGLVCGPFRIMQIADTVSKRRQSNLEKELQACSSSSSMEN